ncbi:hypothetical protein ACIBG8_04080 [Nonomuraea sp. NPDC050556]|uniref:hypothetical protein n=1 Tax=Nonomuraea sp. NPDC050556 TaxID=3364369 RepID=UPI00379760AD
MDAITSSATFPAVTYDNGILQITVAADPPGFVLYGALDLSGFVALQDLLAVMGGGPVDAHLGELDFIDVGCLRVLVNASLNQVIKVVSASAPVGRLLRLTGWNTLVDWRAPDPCSITGGG